MTRRSVRLVLPLVAVLSLAACGGDDPEEPTGAGGASSPSVAESESSDEEPSSEEPSDPPATSGGTELTEDQAASCAEFETIVTDITSEFPDGVGLDEGVVPGEEQVGAVTSLVEGFEGVEVSDDTLGGLRDALVDNAQTILDRAEAGEALTTEDSSAFSSALIELGTLCEGAA
jgi:hypothetical protein